jgi:predicted ABC-type ATPase
MTAKPRRPAPSVIVLAGPNGAGKTTAAPYLLRDTLGIAEFVNADQIARGLSAFRPEAVAVAAGRLMLARLEELARERRSFAFETTLASRTFCPWLEARLAEGYRVHLVFLWLPSPDLAVTRVADRVARGGHGVPEEVVRRRYAAGLRNFFRLYRPIATVWEMYDSAAPRAPRLIATGQGDQTLHVGDRIAWEQIVRQWTGHGT